MASAEPEQSKKRPMLALLMGVLFAICSAGGGFMIVKQGILPAESLSQLLPGTSGKTGKSASTALAGIAFVEIPMLVISLGSSSSSRHLRFTAQLETTPEYKAEVEALMPRIVDILNSYLRAVETSDFDESAILIRLRVQMLRRVQLVTGPGRVKDLLIMEFVLN